MTAPTKQSVRDALLEALANVEGVDGDDIEDAIKQLGGDQMYEIESKTAEAILAEVGEALGFTPVGPADLRPEQFATVDALVDLVLASLGASEGVDDGRLRSRN